MGSAQRNAWLSDWGAKPDDGSHEQWYLETNLIGAMRPTTVSSSATLKRTHVSESTVQLKKLLQEIFEDEIVEPKERDALTRFTDSMSNEEKLAVFQQFLSEKWGEAIADDVLTGAELRLLGHIMAELNLELRDLPEQARFALRDVF